MAEPVIPLASNVYRIPTTPFDLVNSFALVDDDGSVTLVDAGLKTAPARIVAGLAAIGKAPADVQRIILTHAHADHAGGAAELARLTGRDPELHGADAGCAGTGVAPLVDASILTGRLYRRATAGRRSFEPFTVGSTFGDGDLLDVAGGLRVVHTPGHSPGHVSLLHEPSGVLIVGDALFNVVKLRLPLLTFCSDIALTRRSAHRLADLEYSTAAFMHGPQVSDRARERVRGYLGSVQG
jgi:glyoxylase-like metal-dependent hydrolase (beta-lactamase superfamily II)